MRIATRLMLVSLAHTLVTTLGVLAASLAFGGRRLTALFGSPQSASLSADLAVSGDEFHAVLPSLLGTLGIVELAALALNAMVFGLFGLWLMRRIAAAAEGIERIGNGELTARIAGGRSTDEIARLQRGVNAMAERLAQRMREERAAWAEMAEGSAMLRAVLDNAPALISLRDPQGRFILVNRRYEEVLQVREADLLGRTLEDVFEASRADELRIDDGPVLREGRPVRRELALPVDGEQRWFLAQRFPLIGITGQRGGICGIASDITELKLAAADAQARRDAEAASRAKCAFLASMGHALRTPLNGVLGYAQLLRRERGLTQRQQKSLATIQESGEQLLSLINDLLDLARIETGEAELNLAATDIAGMLDAVRDIVRVKAEAKSLRFAVDSAGDLPRWAMADGQRLRQVLLHLLGHALQFTGSGELRLRVQVLPDDAGGDAWRFEIDNSGAGRPDGPLTLLALPFEPWSGKRQRAGGAELGLVISQRLVDMMGGTIHAENRSGSGSRFRFDVRLARTAAMPEAIAAPEQPVSGYAGPRRKLLVVDDVPANRASLVGLLGGLGFIVFEAVNGGEALERIEADWPDLVLMDIRMPVMSGLLALQRLSRMPPPPGRHRPVVLMTSASTSRMETASALAAGAHAVLRQPIDHAELLSRIATLLGLQWDAAQGVPAAR